MSSGSQVVRHVGKLHADKTCLLLCDMQERFRPLIHHMPTVVQTTRFMTGVAKALSVPIVATQQYTKVFGETIPECFSAPEELLAVAPIYDKKNFSMLTDEVQERLNGLSKDSFIIVGIESHICVQQTCLDLLEQGKDVHVIADGVSSQQPYDRKIALKRLQQAGAFVTTAQSAAFMLMQSADHEAFKTLSKLTIEHMKLPNAFNEAMLK